jgi:hypothetical protein
MVIYNELAKQDLIDTLYGLITWKKHELNVDHCERYVDDIVDVIDTICKKTVHRNCVSPSHLKYGDKFFTYKRNYNTQWYFIYNWDKDHRIAYLNRIMNNHITV